MWRVGLPEAPGQVSDDQACRVIRLPLCEGVSSADLVASQAGVARQTMRRDGGRTAIAVCLFAQYKRAFTGNLSWHDLGRGRYLSLRRGADTFSKRRGIREDGTPRMCTSILTTH